MNPHQITVEKLDAKGREAARYPATVVEWIPNGVVLRARWGRPRYDLGYLVLEPDDQFTEYFFTDRWYNIFEIRAADGRLKGWYCNLSRPATITDGEVSAVDLYLDLFVYPDGKMLVLDEEELEASGLREADPEAWRAVQEALAELQAMVRAGHPPFSLEG
ncbi:MAG: DUF402 domain-containing protein [Chloroflexi bacterium]|nr:MAG: DUF402 domain-containing protein [Chloroflexota bacterium]